MRRTLGLITVIALLTLVPAAAGDLLVTREGEVIETQGAWQVKGRQIVFTSLQGVLSSMRLSEVDVEASEEATWKAAEPVEEPAPAPADAAVAKNRKPALVLTNDNLGDPRQIGDDAAELGRQIGEAMAEAMSGLTEGMVNGLAEGFGVEGEGEELGEGMAEEMAGGFAALGDMMGVAVELGVLAKAVDDEHDLDTPEGVRAAADDFERLAVEARRRMEGAGPEAQEMLGSFAVQFEDFAELARRDPEAAVRFRREKMEEEKSIPIP